MPSRYSQDGKRQNGCYTDGNVCDDFFFGRFGGSRNANGHCDSHTPPASPQTPANIVDVQIYPPISQPTGLDKQPVDRVMYNSTIASPYPPAYEGGVDYSSPMGGDGVQSNDCGKLVKDLGCDAGAIFDYTPTALSFQPMDSDTWFGYLYDIGDNCGHQGTPCYHITRETETRNPGTGTTPSPDSPGPVSSKAGCEECPGFTCTPLRTEISYTYNGPDETTDPDCPYPLIFGIGTSSNKVVISYDSLSTTIPNGVTSIALQYGGVSTAAWDSVNLGADAVETSQNPWQEGEETFTTFQVYEGNLFIDQNASGLAVKARITPLLDTTNDPAVIVGTKWELLEVISQGQGYSVGDNYTLEYVHTHPSGDTSTFTIDLIVTGIGPISQIGSAAQFDTLLPGDNLNGHLVLRVVHGDMENFPYHIVYVDRSGADFVADTQYTSDRNHVVTAHAGFGILNRAYYGGYFEFFDKSIQYTTHNVDPKAPDVWSTVKQPDVEVLLTNGQVSGAIIHDGGSGWDTVKDPYLQITDPNNPSGKAAKVEGVFSGGKLVGVDVRKPGSGYSMETYLDTPFDPNAEYTDVAEFNAGGVQLLAGPPKIWVRGYDPTITFREFDGIPEEEDNYKNLTKGWEKAGGFDSFFEARRGEPVDPAALQAYYDLTPEERLEVDHPFEPGNLAQSIGHRESNLQPTDRTIPTPNTEVQADTSVDRLIELPQRRFSREAVETARDNTVELDRNFRNIRSQDHDRGQLEQWKQTQKETYRTHNQTVDQQYDILIQENVPDSINYKERSVTTTQRRFLDMPKASAGTKYYVKQYRADPRTDVYFTVTLTCTPNENGCGHIPCAGPAKPADFTIQTQTVDYEYTYGGGNTVGVQGPGCQTWAATGQQQIRHHMTKSTNTYAAAVAAYGNPFDL